MSAGRRCTATILVLAASCSSGGDLTATTQATPSATDASATPTPSPGDAALPVLSGGCCLGVPLEPGRYATPTWFGTPFSIEVAGGFEGVAGELEQIVEIGRGAGQTGSLDHYVAFFSVSDGSAIVDRFPSTRHAEIGEAERIEVAGLRGEQIDAFAEPEAPPVDDDEIATGAIGIPVIDRLTPAFFYTESRGAGIRVIGLEAPGTDLVIYVEAPRPDFDGFAAEVMDMLETLELGEPTSA